MDNNEGWQLVSQELMNVNATLIRLANLLEVLAGKKSRQQRVTLVLEARRSATKKRRKKRASESKPY